MARTRISIGRSDSMAAVGRDGSPHTHQDGCRRWEPCRRPSGQWRVLALGQPSGAWLGAPDTPAPAQMSQETEPPLAGNAGQRAPRSGPISSPSTDLAVQKRHDLPARAGMAAALPAGVQTVAVAFGGDGPQHIEIDPLVEQTRTRRPPTWRGRGRDSGPPPPARRCAASCGLDPESTTLGASVARAKLPRLRHRTGAFVAFGAHVASVGETDRLPRAPAHVRQG